MYFYVICNMPYVNFLILFLLGYISFVVESAYLTLCSASLALTTNLSFLTSANTQCITSQLSPHSYKHASLFSNIYNFLFFIYLKTQEKTVYGHKK